MTLAFCYISSLSERRRRLRHRAEWKACCTHYWDRRASLSRR